MEAVPWKMESSPALLEARAESVTGVAAPIATDRAIAESLPDLVEGDPDVATGDLVPIVSFPDPAARWSTAA
jgi:hypothetical protein